MGLFLTCPGKQIELTLVIPLIPKKYKESELPYILYRHSEFLEPGIFAGLLKATGISRSRLREIENEEKDKEEKIRKEALLQPTEQSEQTLERPEQIESLKKELARLTNVNSPRPMLPISQEPIPTTQSRFWTRPSQNPSDSWMSKVLDLEKIEEIGEKEIENEEWETEGEMGSLTGEETSKNRAKVGNETVEEGSEELISGFEERTKAQRVNFFDERFPEISRIFSEILKSDGSADADDVWTALSFISNMGKIQQLLALPPTRKPTNFIDREMVRLDLIPRYKAFKRN